MFDTDLGVCQSTVTHRVSHTPGDGATETTGSPAVLDWTRSASSITFDSRSAPSTDRCGQRTMVNRVVRPEDCALGCESVADDGIPVFCALVPTIATSNITSSIEPTNPATRRSRPASRSAEGAAAAAEPSNSAQAADE